MNILVTNYRDRLNPNAGGAEKHLHRIFSRLSNMGHRVVLFTTCFKGSCPREVVDGILVVRCGGDLLFQWNVLRNLKKLDEEFHFDVVVEDLNKLPVFVPWVLKKPVLVQMHHLWRGSIFAEAFFPIAFGVWLFETLIPLFYRKNPFVVVSPSTKKELASLGIKESRIDVVYNGTDEAVSEDSKEVAAADEEKPYFLWLSRVHRYKGIWVALDAFKKFSAMYPEVQLMVAGGGPLLGKLLGWLKRNGLEDKVELCGFVPLEKKKKLMERSLALLQTSYKEGWGLTVVEAALYGKPTVASDVAGLKDSVVHGKTGLLFEAGNVDACVRAMKKIYEDSALRKTLGENAKAYAKTFSWDTAAEQTLSILEKLVEKNENAH
ncbi:MAG: glycosyltransferase family 4 protein [Fibrobacteraceae bacterium]|nr:glycosyltransferase family 4 protein [Fibrobacteraceae bacterium]